MAAFQSGTIHLKTKSTTQADADAGWMRVYAKSDGSIYRKDENGVEYRFVGDTEVSSISGSLQGQISAITIPTSATFLTDYDNRYVNVSGDTMTGKLLTPKFNEVTNETEFASVSGSNFFTATSFAIPFVAGIEDFTYIGSDNSYQPSMMYQGTHIGSNNTLKGTGADFWGVSICDNTSINGYLNIVIGSSAYCGDSIPGSPIANYNTIVANEGGVDAGTSIAVVVGTYAYVSGNGGIAIGYYAEGASNAVAIGNNTKATGSNSIAIGAGVINSVANTVVIGDGNITNTTLRGDVSMPYATVDSISGSSGNIVIHDADGKLLDSGMTIPTSATFLTDYDNRYVNVAGDTMTGNLIITSDNANPALQINSDGDARIRLNNPTGNEVYSELSFAALGVDKYGIYNAEDGEFAAYDYTNGKNIFSYFSGTKKFTLNPGYLSDYTFNLQSSDDWIFRNNGSRLEVGAVNKTGTLRFYDIWAELQSEISWSEYGWDGVTETTTNDKFSIRALVGDYNPHTEGVYSLGSYSYPLSGYTFIVDNEFGGVTIPVGDFTISALASISGASSLVAHDINGKLVSTGLNYTTLATKQEVYNLDVDLQGQIVNVLNPAEVANISGSAVTIDSFPHYNEIGSTQWLVHLDDGTNVRFSKVMVTYLPNSTIKFTEESVESIGTTTDAVLSVTTDATNVYLKLTSSNLWNFKTKRINL